MGRRSNHASFGKEFGENRQQLRLERDRHDPNQGAADACAKATKPATHFVPIRSGP
jgi:hypothetical protein